MVGARLGRRSRRTACSLGAIHAHVKALVIPPDRVADVVTTSPGDPSALAATRIARGLIRFAYLPGLMRYAAEGRRPRTMGTSTNTMSGDAE